MGLIQFRSQPRAKNIEYARLPGGSKYPSRVSFSRVASGNSLAAGLTHAFCFEGGFAFNAVTGLALPIVAAAGTPVIAKPTPQHGNYLHTPSGSIARLDVNSDWASPCTIIFQCFAVAADNPWGNLFAKLAGANNQWSIGRYASGNEAFVQRKSAVAISATGSGLTSTFGRDSVWAVHSSSPVAFTSIYVVADGVEIINSGNADAQDSGTGALFLGGPSNLDTAFDSDVYWRTFLRYNRVLSAPELRAVTADIDQLFEARYQFASQAAASSSLPTLSSPTFVPGSRDTTGFRPRVTATY